MRRFFLIFALPVVLLCIIAGIIVFQKPEQTVPLPTINDEPNAIFAYDFDGSDGRISAVLFDRTSRSVLKKLDTVMQYPLMNGSGIESNNNVQYSPATGKIYAVHSNNDMYAGIGRVDPAFPYDWAIVETDFEGSTPKPIFSCDECFLDQWLVDPVSPTIYVTQRVTYTPDTDSLPMVEGMLLSVALDRDNETTTIGPFPSNKVHLTSDRKTIYTLTQDYGQDTHTLTTMNIATGVSTTTDVTLPKKTIFDIFSFSSSSDVSPDARFIGYMVGVVDIHANTATPFFDALPQYDVNNFFVGWSGDSSKMLFQLMESGHDVNAERIEVPMIIDRHTRAQTILPTDLSFIEWAPSNTAILFNKSPDEIGYYDLRTGEWTPVMKTSAYYAGGAQWVTL